MSNLDLDTALRTLSQSFNVQQYNKEELDKEAALTSDDLPSSLTCTWNCE